MAIRSMISDHLRMDPKTVIEVARRSAGLSQRQLARWADTQQSSISEYESRRKSPTLDVVERLLDAAGAELVVRPMVMFDLRKDSEIGQYVVPDRLWSVPLPECFAKVQVLKYIFKTDDHRIWDLSDPGERIGYYELALVHGTADMLLDSVDGQLLVQAWRQMRVPDVIRDAWQPLIDGAAACPGGPPRDPGGISAHIAREVGLGWPPRTRGRRRRR